MRKLTTIARLIYVYIILYMYAGKVIIMCNIVLARQYVITGRTRLLVVLIDSTSLNNTIANIVYMMGTICITLKFDRCVNDLSRRCITLIKNK